MTKRRRIPRAPRVPSKTMPSPAGKPNHTRPLLIMQVEEALRAGRELEREADARASSVKQVCRALSRALVALRENHSS